MSNPPSKRKSGGQPGNTNAIKHGFYTIKPEVLSRLETDIKGQFLDEIDAIRNVVDILLRNFGNLEQPTLDECLTTLRGISQSFDTMKGLYLTQRVLYSNQTTVQKIIEELSAIPVDED